LPYSPDVPQAIVEEITAFRNTQKKLNLFSMTAQMKKMNGADSEKYSSLRQFAHWQKYTWQNSDVPAGIICSSQMEKRNPLSVALELLMRTLGLAKISPFSTQLSTIYEAPFPSPEYKMAVRAMPTQVPIIPDPSLDAQKKAWEFFETFEKPFFMCRCGE